MGAAAARGRRRPPRQDSRSGGGARGRPAACRHHDGHGGGGRGRHRGRRGAQRGARGRFWHQGRRRRPGGRALPDQPGPGVRGRRCRQPRAPDDRRPDPGRALRQRVSAGRRCRPQHSRRERDVRRPPLVLVRPVRTQPATGRARWRERPDDRAGQPRGPRLDRVLRRRGPADRRVRRRQRRGHRGRPRPHSDGGDAARGDPRRSGNRLVRSDGGAGMSTRPQRVANFIGGEWTGAASGRTYPRENPAASAEIVVEAPDSDAGDVASAVGHVAAGRHAWSALAPEARAGVLYRAADILASRAEQLAAELVREEGKTLTEARVETRRTPQNLRMYAGEALRLTGESYPAAGSLVVTTREPVGVVAAITPWNFPLNIPSRKVGPALAAGNGVVFKPSELTPLLGQRLVEALLEAGVPGSALAMVNGHADVGKALVADTRVGAVTFTGSTAVGEAIHANVSPWVRCQLETGGKNAVLVWDDADLDLAADIVVKGAFGLAGQAFTGTSRVVAHEPVVDGLLDRVLERAQAIVVGNGLSDGVTMGPLASSPQQEKYRAYLSAAGAEGAVLETPTQDREPAGGYFARPAIFTGVRPEHRLAQQE